MPARRRWFDQIWGVVGRGSRGQRRERVRGARSAVAVCLAMAATSLPLGPFSLIEPVAAAPFTSPVPELALGLPAGTSDGVVVAPDGRAVGLRSDAPDVIDGLPASGDPKLYVVSRATGTKIWVDAALPAGSEPDELAISSGGRFAAFSALVSPGSGVRTVYTVDLTTGTTERVEPSDAVVAGAPSIDDAGNVAYEATVGAGPTQIRRWSRFTHDREPLTFSPDDGMPGNGSSADPALSADGSTLVFTTTATNLVPGATLAARHVPGEATARDVVAMDLTSFEARYLSAPAGTQVPMPGGPSYLAGPSPVSRDGRFVAFVTEASVDQLAAGAVDGNGAPDAVLHDRSSGTNAVASATGVVPLATACSGSTRWVGADDNGAVVMVTTCGLGGAPGATAEVVRREGDGTFTVLSHDGTSVSGQPAGDVIEGPATSGDGNLVAFRTTAAMDAFDDNGLADGYTVVTGSVEWPIIEEVPGAGAPADACPDATFSVTADFDAIGNASLVDAALGLDLAATWYGAAGVVGGVYSYPPGEGAESVPVRALVLEVETPGGGRRTVRADAGIDVQTSLEADVVLPAALEGVATRVAACVPAAAGLAPRAYDDQASTVAGNAVLLDVLANDEGYLNEHSLRVVTQPASGWAENGSDGDTNGIVVQTDAPGLVSITYQVDDWTGGTVVGTAYVDVADVDPQPFTLSVDETTLTAGDPSSVVLRIRNDGEATLPGVVSARLEAPAAIVLVEAGPAQCSTGPGGASITCLTADLAPGEERLIDLLVSTPEGPQALCEPFIVGSGACVVVHAWNGLGTPGAEAAAVPAAIRAAVPVEGGQLSASVVAAPEFVTGQAAQYQVTITNTGAGVLPAGATVVLRSFTPDMPFVTGGGSGWSCVADPVSSWEGRCTTVTSLEPGATATFPAVFTTGAGTTECPDVAPCALLTIDWTNGADPPVEMPLGSWSTPVVATGPTDRPNVAVQLDALPELWVGNQAVARVEVVNAGLVPTTAPVLLTLDAPAGISVASGAGAGWTCTGGASLECTYADVLPAGTFAPSVLVTLDVGAAAVDGTVAAHVSTLGDLDGTNDSAVVDVVVRTGDPYAELGLADLYVEVLDPTSISPGGREPVTLVARNRGDAPTDGPTTIWVQVPDGWPGGNRAEITSESALWSCNQLAFAGVRELRCTYDGIIEAGAAAPALVTELFGANVFPGSTVEMNVGHRFRAVSQLQRRIPVTEPRVARLDLRAAQAMPVLAGSSSQLTVEATNTGNGSTVGTATVQVELADGLTATQAVAADSEAEPPPLGGDPLPWACSPAGSSISCTNDTPVDAGSPFAPLVLDVAAPADHPGGPVSSQVTMNTADSTGPVEGSLAVDVLVQAQRGSDLQVARDPMPDATDDDRAVTYGLAVRNTNPAAIEGQIRLEEAYPLGTEASVVHDGGWDCTVGLDAVDCIRTQALASMETTPSIQVTLVLPDALAGAQAQLLARATVASASGSSAAAVLVAAAAPAGPRLLTGLEVEPMVLQRGGQATATVTVTNDGSDPATGPTVVGMVLDRGIVPVGSAGDGWTCDTDASTPIPVLLCRHDQGIAPGADLPAVTVPLLVSPTAPDSVELFAGTLGSDDADPAVGLHRLAGEQAAALAEPANSLHPVRDLVADAGDDRSVPERTAVSDGTDEPTRVLLDGRRTQAASTAELEWRWVQIQGPEVRWTDEAGTVPTSDGAERPFAEGPEAELTVPRLPGEAPEDLVFELTVRAGDVVATDQVTVRATPSPDRAPTFAPITTDLGDPSVAPADGTPVGLATSLSDPEGDLVGIEWRIVSSDASLALTTVASDTGVVSGPDDPVTASFAWPQGATYVVVEVAGASARGAVSTANLVIGAAPATPTLQVTGPDAAVAAGAEVALAAAVTPGAPEDYQWRWIQTGGPDVDPEVVAAADGPALSFPAPAVAEEGQAVTFQVVATKLNGIATQTASAEVVVALAGLPPLAPVIEGHDAIEPGATAEYSVTGVDGDMTVAWEQAAGPEAELSATEGAAIEVTGGDDGEITLRASVTGAGGRVGSAEIVVTVGDPFTAPEDGPIDCGASDSVIAKVLAAATGGQRFAGTLGPVSVDLGNLSVTAGCTGGDPTVTFSDATFSVADGTLVGKDLAGSVSTQQVCLNTGTVEAPESWGLQSASVSSPICVNLTPGASPKVTGGITFVGLPMLALPDGATPPVTTITFSDSSLSVAADASLPDASLPDAGTISLDFGVDFTTGAFTATADGSFSVLGTTLDIGGNVVYDGTTVTDWGVYASLPGPVDLVPGTSISGVKLSFGPDAITVEGTVKAVEGAVELTAKGSFVDSSNFDLNLTGKVGGTTWEPVPGLVLPDVGFAGTVKRAANVTEFDVSVTLSQWTPAAGVTIENLTARLGNAKAPADCPTIPAQTVWLMVTGAATVQLGDSTPLELEAAVCVAPSTGAWTLRSKVTADSWRPIPGVDVTVQSAGVRAKDQADGQGVSFVAFGAGSIAQLKLSATVSYDAPSASLVVDAMGEVTDLVPGLGGQLTGHVLYASAVRPGYQFVSDAALGTIDPELPTKVKVQPGFSVYLGFSLDDADVATLETIGLPAETRVVLSAEFPAGGAPGTFTASLDFGDTGILLYNECGGPCNDSNRTRLALQRISLTLSTDGSFGLTAAARLDLAATDQTPNSSLDLKATVTIDPVGPKISFALYLDGGVWFGALGTPGLDISDLAIQGGYDFATATPSVGFGATIDRLPDSWAAAVGITPDRQEAMRFAFNISTTEPIFELTLGKRDGNFFLRPLVPVADGNSDVEDLLQVDYASLVLAPLGGKIGAKVYPPGVSFGFAAKIVGVDVDVLVTADLVKPKFSGTATVGPIEFGGLTIRDVAADFTVAPTEATVFRFKLNGAMDLPKLTPTSEAGTLQGSVDVQLGSNGFRSKVFFSATNIGFRPFGVLKTLSLNADVDVPASGPPTFKLGVEAQASIAGLDAALWGHIAVDGGVLEELSFNAHISELAFFDRSIINITGDGCPSRPGLGAGLCVGFTYNAGKVGGVFDARLEVLGGSVALKASLTDYGMSGRASVNGGPLGSFAVEGAVYWASAAELKAAGVKIKNVNDQSVDANPGDFRLEGAARLTPVNGFQASMRGVVVSTLFTGQVFFEGSLKVPGGEVSGSVFVDGTRVQGNFIGKLEVAGYKLAEVFVVVDTTSGLRASAFAKLGVDLPGATAKAELEGSFWAPANQPMTYDLKGSVGVRIAGVGVTANLRLANSVIDVAIDLGTRSELVFKVQVRGTLYFSGALTVRGSVSAAGFTAALEVSAGFGGFSLGGSLTYGEHTLASFTLSNSKIMASVGFRIDESGDVNFGLVRVGGRFVMAMSLSLGISWSNGYSVSASFAGEGSVYAWAQWYGCTLTGWDAFRCAWGEGWAWGSRSTIANIGASVNTASGEVCATIVEKKVCV